MGRGRAKAKQTKVARQLKYSTSELDVEKLSVELGAAPQHEEVEDDPYDPYAAKYSDYDGTYDGAENSR